METMEIMFQINEARNNLGWLGTQTYTISIGKHRIVTVFTACTATANEWFSEVLKHPPPSSCNSYSIIVGFTAETAESTITKRSDPPYDFFSICVGNQCLIYRPKTGYYYNRDTRDVCILRSFFSDPRVVVIGQNMDCVSKKLERDLDIKFYNSFDVNKLASITYPPPQVDEDEDKDRVHYKNYSLDDLARVVLGKQVPRIIGGAINCSLVLKNGTSINADFVSNKSYHDICSYQYSVILTLDAGLLFALGDKLLCGYADFDPYSCISNSKRKKWIKKKKIKLKNRRTKGIFEEL